MRSDALMGTSRGIPGFFKNPSSKVELTSSLPLAVKTSTDLLIRGWTEKEQGNLEQMSASEPYITTELLNHKVILYMIAVFDKVKDEFDKVVNLRDESLCLHSAFEEEMALYTEENKTLEERIANMEAKLERRKHL
ncbi:unnamed protein product [Fraxinus pennsylvanica]|uniref:Uncharacterized protein n=1 Tax=Fraxinus pennsylvanica TaxID=56036 RepID=A0AAD1Z9M5_9LAMI|nr:unnamed protein product [Fraxinus pennsylvanica]